MHNNPTSIFYTWDIIQDYPHDQTAFTQGLLYHDGVLYESIGGYRQSMIRSFEPETGKWVKKKKLHDSYFGEGITLWQDRLIQLTWKKKVGFVYDLETFDEINSFSYITEGWGITHDGQHLIMSDGTDILHFFDPVELKEIGHIHVRNGEELPIRELNELEYVWDEIFAGRLNDSRIARISPALGDLRGWIDFSELYNQVSTMSDCNDENTPQRDISIAYDEQENRFFVTGKYWKKLFEIKLICES